jgi:hypothetical protein
MLFKFSLIASLVSVAFAAEAETMRAADLQSMAASFDHIFTGIDTILGNVQKFTAPSGLPDIVTNFAAIDKAITEGAALIKKSKGMSIPDLLNILGPVFVMQDKVAEVVQTLSSKKAVFEGAGAKDTIVSELIKTKAAADGLVSAITGNLPLPSITGLVAGPIAATITDVLAKGIKEWGGEVPGKAAAAPKSAAPPKATGIPKGTPRTPKGTAPPTNAGTAPPANAKGPAVSDLE